jgi:hypothetical protein
MLGSDIACPNCNLETTLINSQRPGKSFSNDSGPLKTELNSETNLDADFNIEKNQLSSEKNNAAKLIQIIGFILLITTCVRFAFTGKSNQIFAFGYQENPTLDNAIYQESVKINICYLLAFGCTGAIAALKTFLDNRFKVFIPIIFAVTLVTSNNGSYAKYDDAVHVLNSFNQKNDGFPVEKVYEKYFDNKTPKFWDKNKVIKFDDLQSLSKAAGEPQSRLMNFNIKVGFWIILMGIILHGRFSGKSLFYKNFGWVFAIFTYIVMAIDYFATGDSVSSVVVIQSFTFLKVLTAIASILPYKHKIKFA